MDNRLMNERRRSIDREYTLLFNCTGGAKVLEDLLRQVGTRVIKKDGDGRFDPIAMAYQAGMMDLFTYVKERIHDGDN